ncbi:alpha/beta-hydrolase [Haematococcus lacustris]|uniref:Alpha/beta-hydrolase n=1 Tax=Haematococcus lacustris TaxID=44745 RepID=A0A699ZAK4_HAELA|nr:alpha/beta-hydrolase [Haematococcus lacustris]
MTDNRGIGFSSIPSDKSQYSTSVMAQDVLLVMDHLGWSQAHVAGFSMGGMIATKLAAAAPHRVSSLSILSVTGGGMEILPRCWRGWKYALKGLMAKTPHERAIVDLKLHFSKRTLKLLEPSSGRRLRQVLYEEYTSRSTGSQPQAESGFTGQGYAVGDASLVHSRASRCLGHPTFC